MKKPEAMVEIIKLLRRLAKSRCSVTIEDDYDGQMFTFYDTRIRAQECLDLLKVDRDEPEPELDLA